MVAGGAERLPEPSTLAEFADKVTLARVVQVASRGCVAN
jgi:hypothetical protein